MGLIPCLLCLTATPICTCMITALNTSTPTACLLFDISYPTDICACMLTALDTPTSIYRLRAHGTTVTCYIFLFFHSYPHRCPLHPTPDNMITASFSSTQRLLPISLSTSSKSILSTPSQHSQYSYTPPIHT